MAAKKSCLFVFETGRASALVIGQKNPRARKNKIGTSHPPQKTQNTPPKTRSFMEKMRFSCRKNAFFQLKKRVVSHFFVNFDLCWVRAASRPFILWELKNINHHHHHPESKKRKSSEGNSGSIQPYGRYGNAGKKLAKPYLP